MKPDSLLRKYDLFKNKDVSACRPKSPAHAHADPGESDAGECFCLNIEECLDFVLGVGSYKHL